MSQNTGPPFFAHDVAEEQRALLHQQQARERQAFRAKLEARLRGNPQRAIQVLWNWMPMKRS